MTVTLHELIAGARAEVQEAAPVAAADALNRGAVALIIDVREPEEYGDGHLPDAVNIPRGLLEIRADPSSPGCDARLTAAARSGALLVYCTKNPSARSLLAAQTLSRMGYDQVEVLAGGLNAWAESGLPVENEREHATA